MSLFVTFYVFVPFSLLRILAKCLILLVGARGFEPPTP